MYEDRLSSRIFEVKLSEDGGVMCGLCPIKSKVKIVSPQGDPRAAIMIVGESPGSEELLRGIPFCGASGEFLFEYLGWLVPGAYGFEDFLHKREAYLYITNACLCSAKCPVKTIRDNFCIPRLRKEVKKVDPKLIIPLGGLALEYITSIFDLEGCELLQLARKEPLTSIMSVRGYVLRTSDGRIIFPLIHPASILRQREREFLYMCDAKKLYRVLTGNYQESQTTYFVVNTLWDLEEVTHMVEELPEDELLAFDVETTGVDPFSDRVLCMSISFKDYVGVVIPFDDPVVKPYVERILNSRCRKVGQNIKFDLEFLYQCGFTVNNLYFDTMVGQHTLNENIPCDLTTLVSIYLDYPKYDLPLELYKKANKVKSYTEIPSSILYEYNAHDAIVTRLIALKMIPSIKKEYSDLYWRVSLPTQIALTRVEIEGMNVDGDRVQELTKQVADEVMNIESELYRSVGEKFNARSASQLSNVLYSKLGFPVLVKTKKDKASTCAEALQKLLTWAKQKQDKRAQVVVKSLIELRKRQKVLSTYLAGGRGGIWRYVAKDGKVHPDYHVTGTVSGRLSCTSPPVQTIPKSALRSIFNVPPGYKFIEADYSQAEARVMAYVSQCAPMMEAFDSGRDIHTIVAERIFKKKVHKDDIERKMAKFVVFGLMYGRQAQSVADQFRIPLKEAEAIMNQFFAEFPEVKSFMEYVVEEARSKRVLRNLYGRTRIFPPGPFLPEWERQALNFIPQSTIADHTNQALAALVELFRSQGSGATVILQLHDAIGVKSPEDCVDETVKLIRDVMERPIPNTSLVIPIDVKVSDRWEGGEGLFN